MIMDQSIEGVFAENAGLLRFRRLSYGDHHRRTRAVITEEFLDEGTGDEK
jgi:hypothetical protein